MSRAQHENTDIQDIAYQITELPRMVHHIARLERVYKEGHHQLKIYRQKNTEFHNLFVLESKELKFLFDKCTEREEENIFCYFLQVKALQQNMEQLRREIPDINNINDKYLPPRILQNVHGYFELNTRYPTRLDLSNSWDKYTVENSMFLDNLQNVDFVPVVYFYAIDTKTFCPIEISPKPCPITAEYDYQNSTSKIIKLKTQSWIGSMETIVRYVTSI